MPNPEYGGLPLRGRRIGVSLWTLGWLMGMVPAVCGTSLWACGHLKAEAALHTCCETAAEGFRLDASRTPADPSPVGHCPSPAPATAGGACWEPLPVSLTPSLGKSPGLSDALDRAGMAIGVNSLEPPTDACSSHGDSLHPTQAPSVPLYRLACQLRC